MDTTLPSSSNHALYTVPKLQEDGSNWVSYKTVVAARGSMRYLDRRAQKPLPYAVVGGVTVLENGTTVASTTQIEERDEKIKELNQGDSIAPDVPTGVGKA